MVQDLGGSTDCDGTASYVQNRIEPCSCEKGKEMIDVIWVHWEGEGFAFLWGLFSQKASLLGVQQLSLHCIISLINLFCCLPKLAHFPVASMALKCLHKAG